MYFSKTTALFWYGCADRQVVTEVPETSWLGCNFCFKFRVHNWCVDILRYLPLRMIKYHTWLDHLCDKNKQTKCPLQCFQQYLFFVQKSHRLPQKGPVNWTFCDASERIRKIYLSIRSLILTTYQWCVVPRKRPDSVNICKIRKTWGWVYLFDDGNMMHEMNQAYWFNLLNFINV